MTTQCSPKVPQPREAIWATSTPWQVYFPQRAGMPAKRRFFVSKEAAQAEIDSWLKGRKPDTILGQRRVDEVLYLEGLLPAGTTIRDAVRFFIEHHSGATKVTLEEVCTSVAADLRINKRAEGYVTEMVRLMDSAKLHFGATTLFSALTKAKLLAYIKGGQSYWVRYGRKRLVSVLITKAKEMEAIRADPLDDYTFEDAPKSTPHFLQTWEVWAIMRFAKERYPELVIPFALQFFAGIRTLELSRKATDTKRPLWWSDIIHGERIIVPVEVSKTNDRRVVDYWPPALSYWMPVGQTGDVPVCSSENLRYAKRWFFHALATERRNAGLPPVGFRQNDFRRTYATNSVAVFGGEKTKDRLGHQESSKVLKKHYDGLTTEAVARAYYSGKPEKEIEAAA